MNTPYVKQYNELGELTNLIIGNYLNVEGNRKSRRNINKYIVFHHPLTGEFIGRVKTSGNNRANTCKRKNKSSRNIFRSN